MPNELAFAFGESGTFDLKTTLPGTYNADGVFQVDPAGTALPAGMTLAPDGVITDSGAAAATINGVRFNYIEPYTLPTLTLHPTKTGTGVQYQATVFANKGVVPAGRWLVSPDEPNLRSVAVNTWPDGSSRVLVVAGTTDLTAGVTKGMALLLNTVGDTYGTVLTPAYIDSLMTSGITIDIGAGPQTISDFTTSSPHYKRTWWAGSRVVCARYIIDTGLGVMQAVIDIHAWSNGAVFIECVLENAKLDAVLNCVTYPSNIPAHQAYSGGTLVVNGTTTHNAIASPLRTYVSLDTKMYADSKHNNFRAQYLAAWIDPAGVATEIWGASDPGWDVTHNKEYLQQLTCVPGKHARSTVLNPDTYYYYNNPYARPTMVDVAPGSAVTLEQGSSADRYQPWDVGRHKYTYMSNAGLIEQLPKHDWIYIQNGGTYSSGYTSAWARSSIENTKGCLSYPISWRHLDGSIPLWSLITTGSKSRVGSPSRWPDWDTEGQHEPCCEENHVPGDGFVGFLCQPSPCFIELLQKWATYLCTNDHTPVPYDYIALRGRAWILRALQQAVYLLPNDDPWRIESETVLYNNVMYLDGWRQTGNFEGVNLFYCYEPYKNTDAATGGKGYQAHFWWWGFAMGEIYRIWASELMTSSTRQQGVRTLLEWMAVAPTKFVNDQAHTGGWRFHNMAQIIGRHGCATDGGTPPIIYSGDGIYGASTAYVIDPDCFSNYDEAAQWFYADYPPKDGTPDPNDGRTGTWMVEIFPYEDPLDIYPPGESPGSYAMYQTCTDAGNPNIYDYESKAWVCHVYAAELDIPGAEQMWNTIHDNVTNLSTWMDGWKRYVQNGIWPRNKPLDK
jgi:hypothetical protein